MGVIDELIVEFCPDGVEYRKLGDVSKYIRGITYNKHQESLDDEGWRVLRANNIDLFSGTLSFNDVKVIKDEVNVPPAKLLRAGDVFICAGSGSKNHVGKVAFVDKDMPFTFGGFMGVIRVDSQDILPKFVYHVLRSDLFRDYLSIALDSTTINNLNAKIVNAFEIPVPPIEVQREIVRILDAFAALTDELTAKLAEEATVRKRQYGYYRDRLLSREYLEAMDGEPVEMVRLGDSCSIYDGDHAAPPKSVDGIPFVTISDVKNGRINLSVTRYVSKDYYDRLAIERKPLKGDFLYTVVGTLGEIATVDTDEPFVIQRHMAIIRPLLNNGIAPRYLFHLMQASYIKSFLIRSASGAAQKTIGLATLRSCEIPVPSPATQQKIVDILDRFDALTTSLTDGLPAEIEARRAQYEYYRDRLLDFPRKEVAAS